MLYPKNKVLATPLW